MIEQAIYNLEGLYRRYGYLPYKMSRFEEYELYVRNKDFLVSDQIITFSDRSGRLLAMKIAREREDDFDLITWVPISRRRKLRRGYDQVELLAQAVCDELGMEPTCTLRKIRHNPPQSGIVGHAHRRANVLGVYSVVKPENIKDKRILLLDDIITTGATVSECARVLLTAGAKEVHCAAVAAVKEHK